MDRSGGRDRRTAYGVGMDAPHPRASDCQGFSLCLRPGSHQPALGRETVIWIVACTWATDIGAYFVGASAGGAKLAPRISPSKTWSGLIGGMAWAAVTSAVLGFAFGLGSTFSLAVIGACLAVVGQVGDLAESAAKRGAGVKDSGNLIPGHGGLLDRVDGLVAILVVVALVRLTVDGAWPWN